MGYYTLLFVLCCVVLCIVCWCVMTGAGSIPDFWSTPLQDGALLLVSHRRLQTSRRTDQHRLD